MDEENVVYYVQWGYVLVIKMNKVNFICKKMNVTGDNHIK